MQSYLQGILMNHGLVQLENKQLLTITCNVAVMKNSNDKLIYGENYQA